jgi:transposase
MTKDDVLFGYRQQLFAEAARTSVSAACRTFGVHRSTYYHWKRQVDRHGLEMLRPRERRRPQMPNQLPKMVQERIVSFSLAHPGLGPRRVASELAREKWGGIVVSPNGVWKVLCRHGLNTRAKRLGLIAGYASPYEPPREPEPERHIDVSRPGEPVGIDCFYVGRLKGTEGAIWQITAIEFASSYAWADLVRRHHWPVAMRVYALRLCVRPACRHGIVASCCAWPSIRPDHAQDLKMEWTRFDGQSDLPWVRWSCVSGILRCVLTGGRNAVQISGRGAQAGGRACPGGHEGRPARWDLRDYAGHDL